MPFGSQPLLRQLYLEMTVHFHNIWADLNQGQLVASKTGDEFALRQMLRISAALMPMVPSVMAIGILLGFATWGTPAFVWVVVGSLSSMACMLATIPIYLRLRSLADQPVSIQDNLPLIGRCLTAIALVSGISWSTIIAGLLLSGIPHLSDMAITIGIASTAIGALCYLSQPATNLVWLTSMSSGMCLAIAIAGRPMSVYFYLLLTVFCFIMWRSTMVIWRHYSEAILQSHELAESREREFLAEQDRASEEAKQELRAQRMLADQHDRHMDERRRAMADLAEAFDRSVMHTIDSLGTALTQLGVCASALHEIGEETSCSAAQVNARAANVGQSVQNVSGAAAQLSQSAQLIAQRVEEQHLAATAARSSSLEGSEAVGALAQQAAKVSQIATLIQDIASQTNLLALNATIEAARAGEAGRGFAIVAQEVKQLAGQTRGAINSVGQTVDGIRTRMTLAENTIDSIADQIDLVSDGAAHIAKVIGEQREATLGINSHAHQVANDARSMEDTARTVSHNAVRVKSMSDDIRTLTARLDDQASALRMASAEFLAELKAG